MQEKLRNKLYKKYPVLRTMLIPGIDCDDGWYSLLDEYLGKIIEVCPDVRFDQIKSKFASLRIYIGGNNEAFALSDQAGDLSEKICELCGNEGEVFNNYGWLWAICPECKVKLVNYDKE